MGMLPFCLARVDKAAAQPRKAAAHAHTAKEAAVASMHKEAALNKVSASKVATKSDEAVPGTVLAKEERLKAQIASLRNALAKEKTK